MHRSDRYVRFQARRTLLRGAERGVKQISVAVNQALAPWHGWSSAVGCVSRERLRRRTFGRWQRPDLARRLQPWLRQNGHAVGVTGQVLEHALGSAEGRLRVDDPILSGEPPVKDESYGRPSNVRGDHDITPPHQVGAIPPTAERFSSTDPRVHTRRKCDAHCRAGIAASTLLVPLGNG